MPYLSASAVVIHYEEALYQVYVPFYLYVSVPITFDLDFKVTVFFEFNISKTVHFRDKVTIEH